MLLQESWSSNHLKHHKKIPSKGIKVLWILCRKKSHPNEQTQTHLAYERGSELYWQTTLIFKNINKKDLFISETGAQGLIIWSEVGGGSWRLRNQGNFYKFSTSRCQTRLSSWEYFSCSSWKGGSSDREAGELDLSLLITSSRSVFFLR